VDSDWVRGLQLSCGICDLNGNSNSSGSLFRYWGRDTAELVGGRNGALLEDVVTLRVDEQAVEGSVHVFRSEHVLTESEDNSGATIDAYSLGSYV